MVKVKPLYQLRKPLKRLARDLTKVALLAPSAIGVRPAEAPTPDGRAHLVILRPDGIGDFVLFAREIHRLRYVYASERWLVTLVGNRAWQALAEDWNGHFGRRWFDRFVAVDRTRLRNSWGYRRELAATLCGMRCDELVCPVFSRDAWGALLAGWIPATVRIAPGGDGANLVAPLKWWFDRRFTRLVSGSPGTTREVDRTDELLRALGDTTAPRDTFVLLPVTTRMREEADAALGCAGVTSGSSYTVICPGAAWPGKRWPPQRFVAWVRQNAPTPSERLVVCGGAADADAAAAVAQGLGARAVNIAGKTSLVGLAGILSGASLCIGNDTAAVHLSAAFGRPTICILGGGHWGTYWPYGDEDLNRTLSYPMPCFRCGWECRYDVRPGDAVPCISHITA